MRALERECEGVVYVFENRNWIEKRKGILAPGRIKAKLDALAASEFQEDDKTVTDPDELLARAKKARDEHQLSRAERLTRNVLLKKPGDIGALSVLCSVLRRLDRAQDALDETEPFVRQARAALLTSRAAAMCDLGRWTQAKKEVGRALAIEKGSPEAFAVVSRIKEARPDLYKS